MSERVRAVFSRGLLIFCAVFAVLLAFTFFWSVRTSYTEPIGHLTSTFISGFLTGLSVFGAVLVLVAAVILGRKRSVVRQPRLSGLGWFAVIFSAVIAGAICVSMLISLIRDSFSAAQLAVAVLFGLLAAGLVCILFSSRVSVAARVLLLSLGALALIGTLFLVYFDFSVPLSGTIHRLNMTVLCFGVLFLLSEARLSFGPAEEEGNRSTSFFYILACGLAASLMTGFAAGSLLIRIFCDVTADPPLPILTLALLLAFGLFSFDRLAAWPAADGKTVRPKKDS